MSAIGILNTSVGSTNVGDRIIMDACRREIEAIRPMDQHIDFSSHDPLMYHSLKVQRRRIAWNMLCGTNCLSSHMMLRPAWAVNLATAWLIRPVTTMGVGWGGYQGRPDLYTRRLLRKLLGHGGMLSVRDSYTRMKLLDCGLSNVVNTGCVTTWGLDAAHCASIPRVRAREVVYTLTDYASNQAHDLEAIRYLAREYEAVHLWIQGAGDLQYFRALVPGIQGFTEASRINIIPPSLAVYDAFLDSCDVDYVGTRLHGGIRALQKGRRTLILAVDNRAIEMGRDFGLPVVRRDEFELLPKLIAEDRETKINLPDEAIASFREFLRNWHV